MTGMGGLLGVLDELEISEEVARAYIGKVPVRES